MEQFTFPFGKPLATYTRTELSLLSPDDIYSAADHDLLKLLSEDRRLERKPAKTHAEVLGEYYSMWANTMPDGGLIVVGQDDGGPFSGCSAIEQSTLNAIERAGTIFCPDAHIETRRVPVTLPDDTPDFVLLIRVYYHSRRVVKTNKGKAYWRIADTKREVPREQLRELEITKGEIDLEQESVALEYPDDFDAPLIRQFVESWLRFRRPRESHTDAEILKLARLGKIRNGEFVPNVACALLFALDPLTLFPGCKIHLQRIQGEVELTGKAYNVVKNIFVEGNVPYVITETAKHLHSQLREFSTLDSDGRFYTATEYPQEAWYEAVVNACVHRSYALKNIPTFLKMFDDRLVIESPGGFPPNVSPETIYETHSPRNPHLMGALFYLDFVKASNEGTRRMRDAMHASNLPKPEFSQATEDAGFNSVRVVLRNNINLRKLWIDAEASHVLSPDKWKDLSGQPEMRILNYVSDHGSINVTQTQKLFPGSRWHRMKQLLTSMVDRGLLEHHHSSTVLLDSRACYKLPKSKDGNGDKKA